MAKLTCPVSGNMCVECGLFRGRHVHCSFFKKNIEMDLSPAEVEQRRKEAEKELTAERVWSIIKTPKRTSKN